MMNLKESVVMIAASGVSAYTLCYRVMEQGEDNSSNLGLEKTVYWYPSFADENTHKPQRLHKLCRL